jgi:hypothetical protein
MTVSIDTAGTMAVHRTLLVVDIEKFGDPHRTNKNQRAVRAGLYGVLVEAFTRAGIPWWECDVEDRGDSAFILLPAEFPNAPLVDSLPDALVGALVAYNANRPTEEQIRLRMALHAGEIELDNHGATSSSINLLFRLIEAPQLKAALAESTGVLALITSDWFFAEAVRASALAMTFRKHEIRVKETTATAWISLPDNPRPAADYTVTISLSVTHHQSG